ncbi:hypothetical protein SLEP1_g26957 [Rubroshorea leprosula]|uniref:protein-serine/threonine phosphatase n=1 Tax=Rubroshorea leprosula TaxID=152421 RepID=A0AAV5JNX1_9ROSI|nr:hypothetical protein SLEP1_g26957 [Rubroshorea leprosula]
MATQLVSSGSSPSFSSLVVNPMPIYGSISIQGLSPNMNDRWFIKENLCQPDVMGGLPLHFFAVYDGHGSYHVSSLCEDLMHTFVAEELMHIQNVSRGGNDGSGVNTSSLAQCTHQQGWEDLIQRALKNSFERMDQAALGNCSCDRASNICRCRSFVYNISGSTANVAILSLHHIMIANCGISRAVLCRGGKAFPLSQDHKVILF